MAIARHVSRGETLNEAILLNWLQLELEQDMVKSAMFTLDLIYNSFTRRYTKCRVTNYHVCHDPLRGKGSWQPIAECSSEVTFCPPDHLLPPGSPLAGEEPLNPAANKPIADWRQVACYRCVSTSWTDVTSFLPPASCDVTCREWCDVTCRRLW